MEFRILALAHSYVYVVGSVVQSEVVIIVLVHGDVRYSHCTKEISKPPDTVLHTRVT